MGALAGTLILSGAVYGASAHHRHHGHRPPADNGGSGATAEPGSGAGEETGRSGAITGTSGSDNLVGTAGDDVIRAWQGDDRIDGGAGEDELYGGGGNDVISARDGQRDMVDCGTGDDTAVADSIDDVQRNCETVEGQGTDPADPPSPSTPPVASGGSGASAAPPGTGGGAPSGRSVVLVDKAWTCSGPVNLDLVKVTMRTRSDDAIHLRTNCTGHIGRIEVDTWTRDGLKINAPSPAAHDLVIGGGYIRCHDVSGGHQDGVQAMGGQRVTLRSVEINCNSNPNSQFFVQAAAGGHPDGIVCDGCTLGAGAASTVLVENSARSGVRNSVVCRGRYFDIRIESGAQAPVNSGNTIVPASDPRCHA